MGARTSYAPGTFCWADLSTTDTDAAQRFYRGLLGWEFEGPMAMLGGAAVAAVFPLPEGSPHPSHWNSYVAVEHADDAAAIALELGAELIEPPFDVEPAGRLSLIRDPLGAVFAVWEAADHAGAGVVNVPGAPCWNHLDTPDLDAAQRFYGELFGWTWSEGVCFAGERMNGSAATSDDPPRWWPYFAVDDLDRARARVGELGGLVLEGPLPAGPGSFVVAADPSGAAVCLYAGQLED
jgi:uncharacterized protein